MRQLLYLLYQHSKTTKKLYNNLNNNRTAHSKQKKIITTEPRTFYLDLPKDLAKNLKFETDFIIKIMIFLLSIQLKTRLVDYCATISMEKIFKKMGKSKTNEPRKCILSLLQRQDLRNSNKLVALQKLATYYTWTNIRQQYKKKNSEP